MVFSWKIFGGMDNSLSFYSCNWESLRQPHFPQILESALAVNCEVISPNERAVGGCPHCMLSLTPAGWGAGILLIRTLLTITHFRAVCSVHEAWCLCSGASGKVARLPLLPRLTVSINYLGRRPSEGACSKFICS